MIASPAVFTWPPGAAVDVRPKAMLWQGAIVTRPVWISEEIWDEVLVGDRPFWTAHSYRSQILHRLASTRGWGVVKWSPSRMLCSTSHIMAWRGNVGWFWALLVPSLKCVGSRLMFVVASQLWVFSETESFVRVAVSLVWKAHDTSRLWCFPPGMLHFLRMRLLQSVLRALEYRDLKMYFARIERTEWSCLLFWQSTRSAWPNTHKA